MLFKNITLVDENYKVQKNMNIVTEQNKIAYIGSEAPDNYKGEIIDGNNKLAMPGFFNMHCHVPMVLIRGYGEGLPLHRWLTERMFPFEDLMTSEDMYWGSLLGISEMLSSGVASFSDMYMEMDGICKAVEQSGIKANLSHGAAGGLSPETPFNQTNGWKGMQYLLDYTKNAKNDRIIGDASIHAEYTANRTLVSDIAKFAKENYLRIQLHLSETQKEQSECKERRDGMSPAEWFLSLGVFESPTIAAHCVWLDNNDFDILSKHGVTAVHCPSSNLKLGSGIAPLKRMIDKNINVTIGTDGAASNNNLNMLEEINLAALIQKGANHDPLFLSTNEIIKIATHNGAVAQGREDCGSIKVGNRADIILFDMDKPHLTPVYDELSNILYSAQSEDICLNMIDGEVVYKDGEFTNIDIEKVKYHANRIKEEKLKILSK